MQNDDLFEAAPSTGHGGYRPGSGRKPAGYVKSEDLQDLDKQKARHEKLKADLAEIELRTRSGELVMRAETQRAAATALSTLAQALRSVPDTLERKHNVSPEIAEAVGKEIDDALDNLASAFEMMHSPTISTAQQQDA